MDFRDWRMRTDGPVAVPVWYECPPPSRVQVYQHLYNNCVETVIYAYINIEGFSVVKVMFPNVTSVWPDLSYHDWWHRRCCCCCPPARCCRWKSPACAVSRRTTGSPGECTEVCHSDSCAPPSAFEFEAGTRRMCSPCPCHSPLWSLSHSPPPHWLSCCHWRRSGRGLDLQGWMGPCSRDKNYTLG